MFHVGKTIINQPMFDGEEPPIKMVISGMVYYVLPTLFFIFTLMLIHHDELKGSSRLHAPDAGTGGGPDSSYLGRRLANGSSTVIHEGGL